jgi:hypothetical protein
MSDAIETYSISLNTGALTAERATVWLKGVGGDPLGRIQFYDDDAHGGAGDFVDRGSHPVLHLPSSRLADVLDMLRNEKPVFVGFFQDRGVLSTEEEPIGEAETEVEAK